ncbi:hypothetical protein [Brevibacterium luteolum]|uniref:hypothetical protein n=1 Tax=Brevibacterium luteolum TaxID=199591 RepID=UPI00223BAB4C|nr:hypothetical protein [Brevibacterium luteolum]MCT1828925.1 hypothetical protein [Brevibacterium luteolum]
MESSTAVSAAFSISAGSLEANAVKYASTTAFSDSGSGYGATPLHPASSSADPAAAETSALIFMTSSQKGS